ncbi:hypothetical protein, partial [Pseudomonas sp. PA15(2017)]|uniref:hypothetical protein n=1 Tax=Pseudomonas sp. PA15(2017) TaxID=1932111 RepID=UPI001C477141
MTLVARVIALAQAVAADIKAIQVSLSGLGTAARKNVTTSAIDKTPDRVLRTGDGGWMGDVPTAELNFNLDDRTLRGWRYCAKNTTTGTFPPGVNYGHVHTFGNTGDAVSQELWAFEGASQTYTRWYRQCFGSGAWGVWAPIPRHGEVLQGAALVECGTFVSGGQDSDILIKTNIPAAESVMPSLIIEGAISGYTLPFRIDLSWYFYQGAIYLPNAIAMSAGNRPGWVAIHLSVINGLIAIRLRFTAGTVYLPRVAVRANRTPPYGGLLSYYLGWSATYSAGAQAGEVNVPVVNQLRDTDIERGFNANGSYTRYPDGTVEMWKALSVPCTANTLKQVYIDLPAAVDITQPVIPVLGLGAPTDTWGFECRQLAGV